MSNETKPCVIWECIYDHGNGKFLGEASQAQRERAFAELRRLRAEVEALRAELDAQRVYARQLCKAIDAATEFAGTVAGGASWWDDVWADHDSALDQAREGISAAIDAARKEST